MGKGGNFVIPLMNLRVRDMIMAFLANPRMSVYVDERGDGIKRRNGGGHGVTQSDRAETRRSCPKFWAGAESGCPGRESVTKPQPALAKCHRRAPAAPCDPVTGRRARDIRKVGGFPYSLTAKQDSLNVSQRTAF